jgi:hypothetical protein
VKICHETVTVAGTVENGVCVGVEPVPHARLTSIGAIVTASPRVTKPPRH